MYHLDLIFGIRGSKLRYSMKNQYFGDIQDYRKYGLLRQLTGRGQMRLGIIWMLTPDDASSDGRKTAYLNQPAIYRSHDPELFDALRRCVIDDNARTVAEVASRHISPNTVFYSGVIPDGIEPRIAAMRAAQQDVFSADLIFFDPDNGLEVSSHPKGKKNSSKYVFWDEIHRFYSNGHSVMVYQHFTRENRGTYVQRLLIRLNSTLPSAEVMAFCTSHVAFFIAMQPAHSSELQGRLPGLSDTWGNVYSQTILEES